MKFNSILFLILISYMNQSTIITLYDECSYLPSEEFQTPLSAFIEPNDNLYIMYFYTHILFFDYINNYNNVKDPLSLFSSGTSGTFRSFEIGKNSSIIIINSQTILSCYKDDTSSDSGYRIEENNNLNNNKFDVFSIGNIEDEWRFVIIDTSYQIHFQNLHNLKQYNNIYLASFDPNYASFDNIKCKYYNSKVYCICIDSTNNKFKFYIIPIDKITNSNLLTISDIDFYSQSEIDGNFINIFTFPNSEPLISYSLSSQNFLSNFKEEKIEIENSNIIFENNKFIIGEINENQYYSCAIKSDNNRIILCNIIPYSQNSFTESSVNLEEDIYEFELYDENQFLMVNKNSYGMIINRINSNNKFNIFKILDPTISSTTIKLYKQDFSDNTMIKTIDCFSLPIYSNYRNYYIYINDINGIIYFNDELINKNNYYSVNLNDKLTFYKETNVELKLQFTLNFGKGIINYETFTYEEYLIYEQVANIFNQIISRITNYISDQNIYTEKNIKYQIYYYSDSSSIQTISNNNKLSIVKFNDENISSIKQLNNINENNDIILIKIDIQIEDYPVPSVLIFASDENENILTIPSSTNFTIEKPILNSTYLKLERAYKLKQKSIDVFNSSTPFYNDICFPFSSEINGEDVSLKDRRNEYYVNITFCENNCEYSYFDYVNMKVICNCQQFSQIDDFELLSFSNLKNAFITHLINFNYKVIKCYNLVFNKNNYKNLGTIFLFIIIIISIICVILYIKYHNIEPVKNVLKQFQPQQNNYNEERIESNSQMKIIKDNDEINNEIENNKKNNEKLNLKKNNFITSIDENLNKTENSSFKTRSNKELKNNLTSEEIENKKKKMKELKYDLGNLKYEDALIFDNRTIKQKYWDYLLQSQIILSHFYAELILELRYIKIIVLLIDLSLQFFFNCFFYTDKYISDVYHRNGVISFFSDLPKVIYSILISFLVNTLLKLLSYYKDDLYEIVFKENNFKIYWEKSNKVLNNFYYRINIFIIIVLVFELFFLYYCTAFCAVYPNNQKLLLFSFFQDLLINLLLPFILCFIIAYFKHLSIEKKKKQLYVIIGYLDFLL